MFESYADGFSLEFSPTQTGTSETSGGRYFKSSLCVYMVQPMIWNKI